MAVCLLCCAWFGFTRLGLRLLCMLCLQPWSGCGGFRVGCTSWDSLGRSVGPSLHQIDPQSWSSMELGV